MSENKEMVKTPKHPAIVQMENEYPEMCDEFKNIMKTQYELFCKKMSNYGPDNIALGKTLKLEEDRKMSQMGIWFRVNDKINRLKQMLFIGTSDNVNESIIDTYQDTSIYMILAQMVKKGTWGKD